MKGDTITLSLELSPEALRRQSAMLNQMADFLESPEVKKKSVDDEICTELDAGNNADVLRFPARIPEGATVSNTKPPAPPAHDEATQAQAPGLNCDVDSEGLPHDARIHSSSKAKNKKDGTWKVARNMNSKTVEKVRAELIALRNAAKGAAPAPAAAMPAPPAPASTVAPAPPPAPKVEGNATDNQKNFSALLKHISTSVNDGHIAAAQVQEIISTRGIPQMGLLGKRPDLFDAVRTAIDNAILQNQIAAAQ